jgi:anti-anti-sigma factor
LDADRRRPEAVPEKFRVETRPDRDRVFVVPHGELDLATAPAVAGAIDDLMARRFDRIVLDLRETSFMDSTGLRLVIAQTTRADGRVTLIDGPSAVGRLFDLAGLREKLPFEPTA